MLEKSRRRPLKHHCLTCYVYGKACCVYDLYFDGQRRVEQVVCSLCSLEREETETEIQQAKEKLRSDLLLNE
jgi:hypothetical protein